jgi:mannose-6-phosphate isomerase
VTPQPQPYPLELEPILKSKVWGGRRLTAFGKDVDATATVGESWEVADLPATSPSGGGGGAARSRIVDGPLAGQTLGDALRLWQGALVGQRWAGEPDFPLLVKYLDAREPLSVQVHPTPAYAAAHPGTHVKEESWYIIEADPDAVLYLGLQPGVDRDDLAAAIRAGRPTDVLRSVPAMAGDCHHLPSGTVHALGAGIVVAEVQSPSDTTFRLYDWNAEYGRQPRALHIESALDTLLLDPPPAPVSLPPHGGSIDLATTYRYALRGVQGVAEASLGADRCSVVMVVDGSARVTDAAGSRVLARGSTLVVPSAVGDTTVVDAESGTVLIAELSG